MKRLLLSLAAVLTMGAAVDPAAVDAVGFDQVAPCDGEAPGLEPAAEKAAIQAAAGVSRAGRTLRVGKAVFRDSGAPDDSEAHEAYRFWGRYRAAPLMLVDFTGYESAAMVLVDPKSGEQTSVSGLPLPGPDGKTFLAATRSDADGEPVLQVVEWRGGRFESGGSETVEACDIAWRSATEIALKVREQGQGAWAPARLVRGEERWELKRD